MNCSNHGIKILEDGYTRFSSDSMYYIRNYRAIKNIGLPNLIDTNAIYIESYYIFGRNREKFYSNDYDYVKIYRFYKNGAVNDFSMPKSCDLKNPKNYNPQYTGKRGMCFFENGNWFIDVLAKSSELNTYGTYRYVIEAIAKDTIKLRWMRKNENTVYVYERKEIKNDSILSFNANW